MKLLDLKKFVEDNPKLVSMRPCENYPGLFVLKYKKIVFFKNLWSPELEHCRGTVVDKDFNLVSYPFQKIYNYGIEKNAPVLPVDKVVTVFRKVNGFMVSCTWYDGDILVSTTGSTDSPYVAMAKEMMIKHMPWEDWKLAFSKLDYYGQGMESMTVMFECVHPNDPHIITEKPGMYVLGYRENKFGSVVGHDRSTLSTFGEMFKCYVPESFIMTVGEVISEVKKIQHEGFVFYTYDGKIAAKIKSPYYLTSKWVARNPNTDKLVDMQNDIKRQIDEEYYGLIDAIRSNINEYTALDEQGRLAWVREQLA